MILLMSDSAFQGFTHCFQRVSGVYGSLTVVQNPAGCFGVKLPNRRVAFNAPPTVG